MYMTKTDYILNTYTESLMIAKSISNRVYQNEFNRLFNLKHIRDKFDNKITIKDIFLNCWDKFKSNNIDKLRSSVIKNVEDIIFCKDYRKGYIAFSCKRCDNFTFTAFSCNSRFCSTCGKKYRDFRSIEIQSKLINVSHRHFVFTVAEELRIYFFKYRDMQNLLFDAVNDTLTNTSITSKKEIANNYKLGFVSFLHTFGRDLKPNPHIHALVAEAKVSSSGNVKKYHYFHFEQLRKYFMFSLLNLMSNYLNESHPSELKAFNILKYYLIKTYSKGFYIYAPPNNSKLTTIKDIANYIARYGSHPAI
ncbi:transposase zinc-binding domain-containing protein, partial [Haploplasma axanthum]